MSQRSLEGLSGFLRPEDELLLCCARTSTDAEQAERLRKLARGDLDIGYLLETARTHSIVPLLYWHLRAVCPDALPASVLTGLRDHFASNARRNAGLTAELLRVLGLLDSAGITAVPFKGPLLALTVYGNLALRQFADLDILVRPDDVRAATEILVSSGYHPRVSLSAAQEAIHLRSGCHSEFDRLDIRPVVEVEVHWRLASGYFGFSLGLADVLPRLRREPFGRLSVAVLAPDDLLLVLCVHGATHRWDRLQWICDVSELLHRRPDIDWDRLRAAAAASGSAGAVWLGLRLASDLLGAPLRGEVARRVRSDAIAGALAGEVTRRLFHAPRRPAGLVDGLRFQLRLRERRRDRLRYVIRYALEPKVSDLKVVRLPRFLTGLYYVVRLLRVARKYASSRWFRLREDRGRAGASA